MKRALVFLALACTPLVLSAPTDPVCIVGAGPAGLTIASRLENKGLQTVIFEKQPEVGGKCQAYYDSQGGFHPMGALLYSNTTYTETLPIIKSSGVPSQPFSYNTSRTYVYNSTTGEVHLAPTPSPNQTLELLAEIKKYTEFWNNEFEPKNISVGYNTTIPTEWTVPTSEWLSKNGYKYIQTLFVIGMVPYGYGDLRETPAIYMFQYFVPEFFNFFAGSSTGLVTDFHKVFVIYAKQSVKGPIYTSTNITRIDRSGQYPRVTYTNASTKNSTQNCSKLILAFPPTLNALQGANLALSHNEIRIFKPVQITKYWSGAVSLKTPSGFLFAAESPSPNLPPPALGEPVAFIGLNLTSNVSTTWSWGNSTSNQTTSDALALLKTTLSKVNKDPRNATAQPQEVTDNDVKDFRSWDYFPHYNTVELNAGYYLDFNKLQGEQKTYYASGFNGFETVEFAIRAGKDVVDKFFS